MKKIGSTSGLTLNFNYGAVIETRVHQEGEEIMLEHRFAKRNEGKQIEGDNNG